MINKLANSNDGRCGSSFRLLACLWWRCWWLRLLFLALIPCGRRMKTRNEANAGQDGKGNGRRREEKIKERVPPRLTYRMRQTPSLHYFARSGRAPVRKVVLLSGMPLRLNISRQETSVSIVLTCECNLKHTVRPLCIMHTAHLPLTCHMITSAARLYFVVSKCLEHAIGLHQVQYSFP